MKSTFKSQNCHYAWSEPQQLYVQWSHSSTSHTSSLRKASPTRAKLLRNQSVQVAKKQGPYVSIKLPPKGLTMDNRKLRNKLYKYKMLSHSQPPCPGIATMGPQCWKEGYILIYLHNLNQKNLWKPTEYSWTDVPLLKLVERADR